MRHASPRRGRAACLASLQMGPPVLRAAPALAPPQSRYQEPHATPCDTLSQPARDPTPGPQPRLNCECHMDALRGGSHPLAAQVQLPPGHPLVSELFCQAAGFGMKATLSYTSVPWTSSTSYTSFTPLQAWPLLGIPCPAPNPACGSMFWGWHHPNLPPVPGRCHRTLSPIPMRPVSPWVPPRWGRGGLAGAVNAMCLTLGAARQDGMCCPKWHLN